MKYVIVAIIICVLIITNIITCVTTFTINDYLWREHTIELKLRHDNELSNLKNKIEYKIYSVVHRMCFAQYQNNTQCLQIANSMYDNGVHTWQPLAGFDIDFIKSYEKESY